MFTEVGPKSEIIMDPGLRLGFSPGHGLVFHGHFWLATHRQPLTEPLKVTIFNLQDPSEPLRDFELNIDYVYQIDQLPNTSIAFIRTRQIDGLTRAPLQAFIDAPKSIIISRERLYIQHVLTKTEDKNQILPSTSA